MEEGLTKDKDGNWTAPLPFKSERQKLPNNRPQALNRLMSLVRNFERKDELKEHFINFMDKVFKNGHAEIAPPLEDGEECWYLPLFGVYHPRKPKQIRVVFDSSAKARQKLLALLWFRDNDLSKDITEYRMTVHVFGNSPSPAVAIYGLHQSVLRCECDPDVEQFVTRDFYVDDGLKSLPTVEKAVSLLQRTRGVCSEYFYYYNRSGADVTLTCDAVKHHGPKCSKVNWSHDRRDVNSTYLIWNGQIQNTRWSSRLTLNSDCSVTIKNITEEDYGKYFCGAKNIQNNKYESYTYIYLSVLSVQPSFSQTSNGRLTLQCTLWRSYSYPSCNSLSWLDINQTIMSGDGVTQQNCQSNLTVKLQSPKNRTYTCQYLEEGTVLVSAEYNLQASSGLTSSQSLSGYTVYIVAAAGAVLLLVAVAAGLIFKMKHKKKTAPSLEDTQGKNNCTPLSDPENHVTYAMIDHHKPKTKKQVKEDDSVTYSTVKLQNTASTAIYSHLPPSTAIYSQVNSITQD
ncbi:hypothetical protein WMY93_014429 [Mugilogobius chulae]|uniref:Ig-like domain-containing protein n=1 Tax=Mugilogobius chulae TaxID=88201 RepID=A0AAW0P134_9GOBI